MSLTLHAPCLRADLAEVFGDVLSDTWVAATYQVRLGLSYAIRDAAGAAIACGGLIPVPGGDCWEAWFHARPEAARHMPAVLGLIRLTFDDLPEHDPRPVEAFVRTRAGGRIARALGFHLALAIDGIEIWRKRR